MTRPSLRPDHRLHVLGFSTETGRSAPFTAAQRAIASRIEQQDRDAFAYAHQHHGTHVNLLCRSFLPGEHRIQKAMGAPIKDIHIVMALMLDPTGYIDRQPITAAALRALADELGVAPPR